MIYVLDNYSGITIENLKKFIPIVPKERVDKIKKLQRNEDKINAYLGYMLLVLGLKEEYDITADLNIDYGYWGKPYIKNKNNIFFNISHTTTGVACGISNRNIGIDIQNYFEFEENLARTFCSYNELMIMNNLETITEKSKMITRLWCRKESYLKYLGSGLVDNMCDINVIEELAKKTGVYHYSFEYKQYIMSICGEDKKVNIKKVSFSQLCALCKIL